MSTPAAPIVEKPVVPVVEEKPTEQEITDKYLEAREEGKTADLPVPPPTIPEVIPAPPVPEDIPITPQVVEQQTIDAYLEERKERKDQKRKERGGVGGKQARIDQLTKEKAELEERAKTAEAAKVVPPVEPPKPAVEEPKPAETVTARPKMADFNDVDEYHAAMALWAVEEKSRTKAAPIVVPKEEPKPEPVIQVRKDEFDKFLEEGKRFVAGHPDFDMVLQAAHVRGLTLSEAARVEITRKAAPGVAYWLAKPENDLVARNLMKMDDAGQLVEIGRIMERLAVSPTDFISDAPSPGIRLTNGNTRSTIPIGSMDTDDYIRMRKQERRARR